jgi:hypothetical protein
MRISGTGPRLAVQFAATSAVSTAAAFSRQP